jgi:hypothetical protein
MLNSQDVENIFKDCLFKEGEDQSNAKIVNGIMNKFGFNPERLIIHKQEIAKMLDELPDQFKKNSGGGWTFLNACMTKDNIQWGEHRNIEQLLSLGIATEQAAYLMPREMWNVLPGGMPYFVIY